MKFPQAFNAAMRRRLDAAVSLGIRLPGLPGGPSAGRLDAAENLFFLRQLEFIEAATHQVDYPELKHERFLPTRTGYAPGAVKITYRQYNRVGKAKVISDKSKRLPRVDVFGTEFPVGVRPLGASFGYSIYEIKGAAMAGQPLEQLRANAARETIMRLLEDIAAVGDTETGIKGFVNHSAISSATAPDGAALSPLWSQKSALEKLRDLNYLAQTIRSQTLGVEAPDTVLLPEAHYTQVATEPLGTNSDKTILQFFLSGQPWIKNVDSWHYLSTAGSGSTARIIAYRRSPDNLELKNPHGYEQLPPQLMGLEYEVNCHMSTAGVTIYKPLSAYAIDGV